jgi:hypothetical protein
MPLLRCVLGLSLTILLPLTALADQLQIRGRISRIDLKKKEIVVQGLGPTRGQSVKMRVTADTQILFAGKPIQLAELDIGKRVKVLYDDEDGRCVAQCIRAGELQRVLGGLMEAAAQSGLGGQGGLGGLGGLGGRRPAAPVEPAEPGDVPPVPGEPPPTPPEPPAAAPGAPAAPPAAKDVVTGRVVRVSGKERLLVIRAAGADRDTTIVVPARVAISKGEDLVELTGLKEGDTVTIKTQKKDGKLTAVSVEVGPARAARKGQAADDPDAVPAVPPRRNRPRTISRLREILMMVDQALQQMEKDQGPAQDNDNEGP